MAIDSHTVRLIGKTMKDKGLSGKCITYGVQLIDGQYDDVKKSLSSVGYKYRDIGKADIIMDTVTQFATGETIHQDILFKMLGFDYVDSIDVDKYENAVHVLDLNMPIDKGMHGNYDMVYDGGTMEHCFNIKEVFSNTMKLLKVGGIIIHHVPISGWLTHGYYQFSPMLFLDLYKANGFEDLDAKIHIFSSPTKGHYFDFKSTKRLPDDFNKPVNIFFSARKSVELNAVKFPVQPRVKVTQNSETESILKKLQHILPRYWAEKGSRLYRKITCRADFKRL